MSKFYNILLELKEMRIKMPTENNIPYDKSINNFIIEIKILIYLTLPQFKTYLRLHIWYRRSWL